MAAEKFTESSHIHKNAAKTVSFVYKRIPVHLSDIAGTERTGMYGL